MIYWKSRKVLLIHMMHCVCVCVCVPLEMLKLSFIIFCTCYWFSCMEMHNKRNSFIFNRNAHDAPKMSDFRERKFPVHFDASANAFLYSASFAVWKNLRCSSMLFLFSHFQLVESFKHGINSEACKNYVWCKRWKLFLQKILIIIFF